MYFFLKYIVTLFYKNLKIKIVVCLLRESGPWSLLFLLYCLCRVFGVVFRYIDTRSKDSMNKVLHINLNNDCSLLFENRK